MQDQITYTDVQKYINTTQNQNLVHSGKKMTLCYLCDYSKYSARTIKMNECCTVRNLLKGLFDQWPTSGPNNSLILNLISVPTWFFSRNDLTWTVLHGMILLIIFELVYILDPGFWPFFIICRHIFWYTCCRTAARKTKVTFTLLETFIPCSFPFLTQNKLNWTSFKLWEECSPCIVMQVETEDYESTSSIKHVLSWEKFYIAPIWLHHLFGWPCHPHWS